VGAHIYSFESARKCRVCGCNSDDVPELGKPVRAKNYAGCFDLVKGIFGRQIVRRVCKWVAPDLCSFCAEDGGPKNTRRDDPELYSGLLDRFGEPLLKSEYLPK
jgi:hypothetical protein